MFLFQYFFQVFKSFLDSLKVSQFAIPSNSGTYNGNVPAYLIDSDYSTFCDTWTDDMNYIDWIKLDLQRIIQIQSVSIYVDTSYASHVSRVFGCYVQASYDDNEFKTFATLKGVPEEKFLWSGCLRYFRIIQSQKGGLGFREINIWA